MNRDKRDMRDPQLLGEELAAIRAEHRASLKKLPLQPFDGARLSNLYDVNHVRLLAVPNYEDRGGIAAEQAAKYATEFPGGVPVVSDDPGGM